MQVAGTVQYYILQYFILLYIVYPLAAIIPVLLCVSVPELPGLLFLIFSPLAWDLPVIHGPRYRYYTLHCAVGILSIPVTWCYTCTVPVSYLYSTTGSGGNSYCKKRISWFTVSYCRFRPSAALARAALYLYLILLEIL